MRTLRSIFIWLVLAFVIIFWAGAFAAIRYIVSDLGISPSALLIYRFFPTAVISALAILIFYRNESVRLIPKSWKPMLAITLLWLFGYHLVLNIGETRIPAGPSGLIIGSYPIFTLFLAAIFVNEKLTWTKVTGGLIGFAGIVMLVIAGSTEMPDDTGMGVRDWIKYGAITMIAPISAAVHTIIAKAYLTGENRDGIKIDPVLMTFMYMAPAAVLLIPFFFTTEVPLPIDLGAGFWFAITFLILGSTFISYIGWLWAVKLWGAGRTAATTTYAIPLISLVIAWLFLGETLGPLTLVSAGVIVAGIVITNVDAGKKA